VKTLTLIPLAIAALLSYDCSALASSKVSKVYAANGRRVAVIKETNFGRKVYGENGRRVLTIKP
jgi:hypothetical protein